LLLNRISKTTLVDYLKTTLVDNSIATLVDYSTGGKIMETKDLLVKINYSREGSDSLAITYTQSSDEIKHSSKYLICGGMYNRNGGTITFKAKNIEEATEIANNNLVANAGSNKYEYIKQGLYDKQYIENKIN